MKKTALTAAIVAAGVVGGAGNAPAAFDFTTLNGGADNTQVFYPVNVGGVQAIGYIYLIPSNQYQPVILWLRNQPNDHGLGVCSEGVSNCSTGGGDVNELDNFEGREVIRLRLPEGEQWTSLWVSSLDSNNNLNDVENGTVFFSNDPALNLNVAIASGDDAINGIPFSFGDFANDAVEGDLFTLASFTSDANFDPTAKYVYFIAGPAVLGGGNNNDYLVWKGDTAPIPIPAALPMLLAAVGGLGFAGWRGNRPAV